MRSSSQTELTVIGGKATCPKCGRSVRVNLKRKQLYSHSRLNDNKNCPVWEDYTFHVVSEYPYGPIKADPPEEKQSQRPRFAMPTRDPAYPFDEPSTSVRAYSAGSPGSGRRA